MGEREQGSPVYPISIGGIDSFNNYENYITGTMQRDGREWIFNR